MRVPFFIGLAVVLITQSSMALQSRFLPDGFCPHLLDYTYYSLCYEPDHRQAAWVKYRLTLEMIS